MLVLLYCHSVVVDGSVIVVVVSVFGMCGDDVIDVDVVNVS